MNSKNDVIIIDPASVLLDLLRHWWNLILMVVAGGLLACVAIQTVLPSSYAATTVVAVLGTSSNAVGNVQNASDLAPSITSVLQSDTLREMIRQQLPDTDYTLSATYIENTNLIEITASAATPRAAFQALQAAANNYPSLLSNLMADLYLVTVQQPSVPLESQQSASNVKTIVLGAFFAVFAYAALVVLLSVLRDTVKNLSDMQRKIDAHLLGRIPFAKVARKKEDSLILATAKNKNFAFEESYQLISSRIVYHLDKDGGKVLALSSVAQNEGKTHCLLNIAYSLSKSQKRVLVLDGDFRNPSIAKLLNADARYDNALAKAIQQGEFSDQMLYAIPGTRIQCLTNKNKHPGSSRSLSNGNFAKLLMFAKQYFDYILVDTGPVALVADTTVIAAQCDAAVLLVAQDVSPARAINDAVDAMDRNGRLIGCIYRETRSSSLKKQYGYGSSYSYGYQKSTASPADKTEGVN